MSDKAYDLHGIRILECGADGPRLTSERDAADVVGEAINHGARMVILPLSRLAEDFLDLRTRIAGEVIQKFVTYQLRVVILGDISRQTRASKALRDFVYESDRGRHVWFVANLEDLAARLAAA